jgi:hypothetical protein
MSLSDFDSITLTTPNTSPTPRTTSIVTLENTKIKRKQLSMFLLIIETNDKNNKIIMNTMDHINIQVNMTESHKTTFQISKGERHEGLQDEQEYSKCFIVSS